jgi:hypothetical protein
MQGCEDYMNRALELFWRADEHNEIVRLLIASLEKVEQVETELIDFNYQLQFCKCDLNASVYALKGDL